MQTMCVCVCIYIYIYIYENMPPMNNFAIMILEVHPIMILLSSSLDQRLSFHFVFALYAGCLKYKHS